MAAGKGGDARSLLGKAPGNHRPKHACGTGDHDYPVSKRHEIGSSKVIQMRTLPC